LFTPNGIRAILFDLDGTLRFNQPRYFDILLSYAHEGGFPLTKEQQRCALRWFHYYWAQSTEMLADLDVLGGLGDRFWENHNQRILSAADCPVEVAGPLAVELQRRLVQEYAPAPWTPPGIGGLLARWQAAGFRLAVVSNRSSDFSAELVDLGLAQYFELAVAAGMVNSWKPEPDIFWHSLAQLGVRPEQAVYVGDNYFADVVGARAAGLNPILVDPDDVFPEADCPVIASVLELEQALQDHPYPQPHSAAAE